MMAGVVVTGSVATFVRVSLLDIAGQSIGRSLRKRLFEKLMAQEIGFYDVNRGGELANRCVPPPTAPQERNEGNK